MVVAALVVAALVVAAAADRAAEGAEEGAPCKRLRPVCGRLLHGEEDA